MQFVICIKNQDCDDLVLFKVYRVIADEKAAKSNYIRLIDESGEDYLYPADYFMSITLTKKIEQAILQVV